uniref:Capsid protein n=1 Tax=Faba bean necrotic yellows virus TaxID=59817 RepID=A0A3S8IFS2_9VIRU|nr:capsid protein [Faba bean necrotic yellows virus]
MASTWNWSGKKGGRTLRRPYGRPYKSYVPTTRVVVHQSAVLKKDEVAGTEIKPEGDVVRYKMKKVMLTCTLRMAPGELVNYVIVKCNSPIVTWSAAFTSPALLVKESCQDMITIVAKGKVESNGVAGTDCTKSFNRFIQLGSGITQTQHLYVVLYTSVALKAVLEHTVYVEV